MRYTIINKVTGEAPSLRKPMSFSELLELVDRFIKFNTKKKFKNSAEKISYYNKNSFYIVRRIV